MGLDFVAEGKPDGKPVAKAGAKLVVLLESAIFVNLSVNNAQTTKFKSLYS